MSSKAPNTIKFRGHLYRKAQMPIRTPKGPFIPRTRYRDLPEEAPELVRTRPPMPPSDGGSEYEVIKRCILTVVPDNDACDIYNEVERSITELQHRLLAFKVLLNRDDPTFLEPLQSINSHALPKLDHKVADLVFMGQQAHRALKDWLSRQP